MPWLRLKNCQPWHRYTIQVQPQGFVPSRSFYQILQALLFLIQLFIHLCQKWLTVTQFLTVIIQTIKFVNTEHTELATNMFLKKQLSY